MSGSRSPLVSPTKKKRTDQPIFTIIVKKYTIIRKIKAVDLNVKFKEHSSMEQNKVVLNSNNVSGGSEKKRRKKAKAKYKIAGTGCEIEAMQYAHANKSWYRTCR